MIAASEFTCISTSSGPICQGNTTNADAAFRRLQTAVDQAASTFALAGAVEVNGILDSNLRNLLQMLASTDPTFQLLDTSGNVIQPDGVQLASIASAADIVAQGIETATAPILGTIDPTPEPPPPPVDGSGEAQATAQDEASKRTITIKEPLVISSSVRWIAVGVLVVGVGAFVAVTLARSGQAPKRARRRRRAYA